MQKPIHTPHSPTRGFRRLGSLFGLFVIALVLAACTTPTTTLPNFSLSFSGGGSGTGTVAIEQGDSLDVTVTVTNKVGGFTGTVDLSSGVETAQASGITVDFDPASTKTSTTMTITVDPGVVFTDDYILTVTGTSGSLTKTATLTIDVTEDTTPVPDFSLSFSGGGSGTGTVAIEQGTDLDVTVTVNGTGGFTGLVDLSSGVTTAQASGITVDFDPASTTTSTTMTITVDPSVDFTDDYTLTVTGTSGSLTNTATLTIDVTERAGSIDVTTSAANLSLVQDTDRDVTITVTPTGGFSGDVDLSFDDDGSGIVGNFAPTPVSVSAAATSTLTLSADNSVTPGLYTVTITGTSGTLTDSVDISVTVLSASTVRYVNADSGNDTTGDGSGGNPLATIGQALTDLSGTGTIFLQPASATYDGAHTLSLDIVIEGTGAAEGDAVISGVSGDNGIVIRGGTVTLRNITVDGFSNAIRIDSGTVDLTIDGVTIDGASSEGLSVANDSTTLTLTATDLTIINNNGDAVGLGGGTTTGPSITATFTNLTITDGNGEAIDMKLTSVLDITIDNATITNVGDVQADDNGIELDDNVAVGASFVLRNSTITGTAGIGMVIGVAGTTTIDIGTNNTISGSGGIELSDQRAASDTTVIAASGLTLNSTDPSGTVTGIDSSGDLWEITGTGNQINFGP